MALLIVILYCMFPDVIAIGFKLYKIYIKFLHCCFDLTYKQRVIQINLLIIGDEIDRPIAYLEPRIKLTVKMARNFAEPKTYSAIKLTPGYLTLLNTSLIPKIAFCTMIIFYYEEFHKNIHKKII